MEIGAAETATSQIHELSLSRLIDVPKEKLYAAWTNAKLIEQWWCPRPWTTKNALIDFRPGGSLSMMMHGPDGESVPCVGVFLEIVPNQKIVFTDAFSSAWIPSGKAFIVATITFADEAGQTRYNVVIHHWSDEDKKQHEAMGFEQGWNAAIDQLAEVARSL